MATERVYVQEETEDEYDARKDVFAAKIMEAHDEFRGYPYGKRDWHATDGTVTDSTRDKYREAVDDVLDRTEWTKFVLVPKGDVT